VPKPQILGWPPEGFFGIPFASILAMITLFIALFGLSSPAFANCQVQLEKSLCYTQPMEHWAMDPDNMAQALRRFQERTCLPMPANIKQTLISVYQQYPKEVQQAFCEIKKVFIETGDVSYGAMADFYFDPATVKIQQGEWNPRFSGKPIGYILSISEKNRFKGESNPAYLTRVLQARFGNAPDKTLLPLAVADDSFGTNGALAKTIVHEIGHMLHRAQKVTSTYFLPLSEGAWSKLSFKLDFESYRLKHAPAGYEDRMGLKILTAQDVKPTLDLFKKTGIATLYGGTSPQEDFAEFFMFTYYPDLKWNIQGRTAFDLKVEMANNPAFKAKRDLIRKLMILPEPFSLKNRGTVSGEIGPM
jgi:hypothetical protein